MRIAILLGFSSLAPVLAACQTTTVQGPKELRTQPLYSASVDTSGMTRVDYQGANACKPVRYFSGPGAPVHQRKPQGVSLKVVSAFKLADSYQEMVHCVCYDSQFPVDFSYGMHRMIATSTVSSMSAGEMKITRDAFFKTTTGTRYEFEGEFPQLGKLTLFRAARSSYEKCSVMSVVAWWADDRSGADRAMRFISVNHDQAPSTPVAAPSSGSSADRLRELQKLKDEGLLTEQEYQAKRAEILRAL